MDRRGFAGVWLAILIGGWASARPVSSESSSERKRRRDPPDDVPAGRPESSFDGKGESMAGTGR